MLGLKVIHLEILSCNCDVINNFWRSKDSNSQSYVRMTCLRHSPQFLLSWRSNLSREHFFHGTSTKIPHAPASIWELCCHKQVSLAGRSSCITQNTVYIVEQRVGSIRQIIDMMAYDANHSESTSQERVTFVSSWRQGVICAKNWHSMTWWRHQMETFSALLAICAGNSPVPGEFPTQRPVTRSFDVFFDLRLNKRLRKQPRGWWFETPPCPLWRHRNGRYWSPWSHDVTIIT